MRLIQSYLVVCTRGRLNLNLKTSLSSLQTTLHSNSESLSLQSSPASKPETPTSQLSAANDSEPASLLLNSSTTALKLGCCHVLNQSEQPCSRESDDHRKMVLEDIMMGLNILASGETRCRDQQQPQPSHTRKQVVSEEQQTQRDSHAAADDGGRVSQQDHRTQVCLRSMDTGTQTSFSLHCWLCPKQHIFVVCAFFYFLLMLHEYSFAIKIALCSMQAQFILLQLTATKLGIRL